MKKLLHLTLLAVLLAGPALFGQQAEGEHASETAQEHAEGPLSVVFKWVNLAVLLGVLGYVLKKPAKEFFDSRKADIATGLERAARAQQESAERMNEIEQRLGQLSKEIASLRVSAEEDAQTEKKKIVTEAQREVDRVLEQSRQEMERIAHGIERDIKESVADAVIERASQKLQTRMTPNDQKRVVVRFIKN